MDYLMELILSLKILSRKSRRTLLRCSQLVGNAALGNVLPKKTAGSTGLPVVGLPRYGSPTKTKIMYNSPRVTVRGADSRSARFGSLCGRATDGEAMASRTGGKAVRIMSPKENEAAGGGKSPLRSDGLLLSEVPPLPEPQPQPPLIVPMLSHFVNMFFLNETNDCPLKDAIPCYPEQRFGVGIHQGRQVGTYPGQ